MRIAFPYMGNYPIAFKMLIENIGHCAVLPPKPSMKTLSLGVQYSPEYACLPFKILLGSYLEAIEQGAEMIVTSGGSGPCRAGYYGILHEKILRDLGYNIPVVVFDSVFQKPRDFLSKLSAILKQSNTSWYKFAKVFNSAWQKLKIIDEIELASHHIRPLELNKGTVTKVVNSWLYQLDGTDKKGAMQELCNAAISELKQIPCKEGFIPLKIGMIGEIYVVLEPFVNFNIIETLGEMGVYVNRSISLTGWTKEKTFFDNREKRLAKKAYPYLKTSIGGHGINSIGEAVEYSEHRYDGLVHLAPFSCIPEIVSKGILTKISKQLSLPTLTVFLDEQTGKAGFVTRLEAFIDLLYGRREKGEVING